MKNLVQKKQMLLCWAILSTGILSYGRSFDYPFDNLHTAWVDSVFNSLTFDQRIGQLFIVAAYSDKNQTHADLISEYISKYHIGGVVFFQGGPLRQAALTNRYQYLSQTPLLVAMDAEWGLGMRLDSCISFPRQMPLGAVKDAELLLRMGREIGLQCRRMGVHLNFAPVADVNSHPENPVIGIRSFGETAGEVARRCLLYMKGMQEQYVLTTAKHFPGHGNTTIDSHLSLPLVEGTYATFDVQEWLPYKELIRDGLTGILAAHIHVPALDTTPDLAASLSLRILNGILRDSLGFTGLIFTDALNMKGVTQFFSAGEAEVKALEAGADVLLMPADLPASVKAVKDAVNSGRVSVERIEMSCRRILAAKQWVGLNRYRPVDMQGLSAFLNRPEADLLNRILTRSALTVIQNDDNILPLKSLDKEKTAILMTGVAQPNAFLQRMNSYEENDCFFLNEKTTPEQEQALEETLKNYTRIIVSIHNTKYRADEHYGIPSRVFAFVDELADNNRVVLCLFAPPYALADFKNKARMKSIVVAYQDAPLFQDYVAQTLYGALSAEGSLPVSVDSVYHYRDGLHTEGILRLKYSIPEDAGVSSQKLAAVDTLIQAAIAAGAMPGCQILAARNGTVFFSKEYGQTRYDDKALATQPTHIYDLASVTKISATLPSIMLLLDRDELRLRDRLNKHIHFPDDSEVGKITLTDLLTHQARLPAGISSYLDVLQPLDSTINLIARTRDERHTIRLSAGSWLSTQSKYKNGIFTPVEDSLHHLPAAQGLYVLNTYRDTIFGKIKRIPLLPVKQYLYSDLGFILLAELVEQHAGIPIDEFVAQNFYRRLGATTLGYHPLRRFPSERIVPTANDTVFRNQWLQGYAHDENAALMGGVSGHAGLFGNANDLAKLMQMYMNKGEYGGERYIEKKTIDTFTECPFCRQGNRRGIGFDKPEPNPEKASPACACASPESYGHSGFTGTYVWMDPETGLLFIFLSNRICPNTSNNKLTDLNVRTRAYQIFAEAIAP
ncbi:MAG: serine hydrolase [Bacteroidales bacterium]|jgi:beta-glucosidase-like glycosyl hydrolase/CubicO group peptidase (beta-lactamase class C family)|nr:serine hydrolase [Bacteroidales bacterium]